MNLKELGKTGVMVPAIGTGTWEMGGNMSSDSASDKEAIQAIRRAIELGMYLVDTAEMYGAGHCEEVVAEGIRPFAREKLFLVSKVWRDHLHYADVIKAAEDSLKRLRTSWLDLFLVHWPNPDVPLSETMQAMERLVERKLVRFIGVSNFSVSQMEEARSYLKQNDIVTNQVDYSLLVRGPEADVLPYCRQHGMTLMAYRPVARGALPNDEFLQTIGKKYGKTAAQVALNWLICQDAVIAIPKAVKLEHVEQNAAAMGWRLSPEDIAAISSHFH